MLSTIVVNVGMTALVFGLTYLLWAVFTRKARREDEQRQTLIATGRKVWAKVLTTRPTGQSAGRNVHRLYAEQYYVQLDLECAAPDGTLVRCTTKALPPPDWHALQAGDQVQVYQALDQPTAVALDTIMTPRYLRAN